MSNVSTQMTGELLAPDIEEMLENRRTHEAREALSELLEPEVADLLMHLSGRHRAVAFRLLPREKAADVFTFLEADEQEQLLESLNTEQLVQLMDEMDPDDRAELFDEMPGQLAARLLNLLKPEERRRTQKILGYPAQSIGRFMTPEYVRLRPEWTVGESIDHIRRFGRDAETLSVLYVVDPAGRLLGELKLRQLILSAADRPIRSIMDEQVVSLNAHDDREEAVRVMERYDRPALPVIDRDNVLVGIVTFDDVADVAEEETTEDFQKLGGVVALDTPYLSASVFVMFRNRVFWLMILFLGQMLTVTAMESFEDNLQKAIVLAMFIPLIISSGGNSGSQATSLIIRAMALNEVRLRDWFRVLRREAMVGLMLGVALAIVGIGRVMISHGMGWGDYTDHFTLVALTVAFALVGVVLWGSLAGSMLPFILRRLGLDPATSSAPFVATLVDVTGLLIYFNVAMLLLRGTLL